MVRTASAQGTIHFAKLSLRLMGMVFCMTFTIICLDTDAIGVAGLLALSRKEQQCTHVALVTTTFASPVLSY